MPGQPYNRNVLALRIADRCRHIFALFSMLCLFVVG